MALQQFILRKMGRTWDDIVYEEATIVDIDDNAIRYFRRLPRGAAGKATEARQIDPLSADASPLTILQNLGLANKDGQLKNAALLLFGPLKFFPCVEFRIGRFGKRVSD